MNHRSETGDSNKGTSTDKRFQQSTFSIAFIPNEVVMKVVD